MIDKIIISTYQDNLGLKFCYKVAYRHVFPMYEAMGIWRFIQKHDELVETMNKELKKA
jgi:hypothetical protein